MQRPVHALIERSLSSLSSLSFVASLVLFAALTSTGCRDATTSHDRPDAGSAGQAPPSASASAARTRPRESDPRAGPLLELARVSIEAALADTEALMAAGSSPPSTSGPPQAPPGSTTVLAGACAETRHHVALRRSVARAAPFVRAWARASALALLGPARASAEGSGSVGALDAAVASSSCDDARAQLDQIKSGLRLALTEVKDAHATLDIAAQAVSDSAFDLGLAILEAGPGVPSSSPAALADAQGALDAVLKGSVALVSTAEADPVMHAEAARTLTEIQRALAPVVEALSSANSLRSVHGRAALVVATGQAGAFVRSLGQTVGAKVRVPYRPLGLEGDASMAAVSALTLPAPRRGVNPAMAALGARLFAEKRLARDAARSCAGCHDPAKGYSDGRRVPTSLEPEHAITRNVPTLLYTSLNAAQRWDGRAITAEDQALGVLSTRAEMGLSEKEVEAVLGADAGYREEFARVFPDGVTATNAVHAISEHLKTLGSGTSHLDRFSRGETAALSTDESAGLDVFAGAGRCTRCHVPPSFAGTRPTDFSASVYGVLGVTTAPHGHTIDPDMGREGVTHRPIDAHGFRTPTARNLSRTAPYFHNGAFATLEDVVDFYNLGGGRGARVDVPNQDPDVRPLALSREERRTLLVFLRTGLLDLRRYLLQASSSFSTAVEYFGQASWRDLALAIQALIAVESLQSIGSRQVANWLLLSVWHETVEAIVLALRS